MTFINYKSGSIMLLVIVFGGIFFAMLTALSGFVIVGNRAQDVTRARAEAFSIAEAGLDYYQWFLSHFPGNTTNGTGQGGPYVISYSDPESGVVGTYTLSITGNNSCGAVQSIDVTSKGVSSSATNVSSTLTARYAAPSVAAYSYIVGSSVWAGADRVINGPYHSNGGIRMDGTTNALVSSSLSTWNCTTSFGCSPAQSSAPGVVGPVSANKNLWAYPTPQVDFTGIAANFSTLKSSASANGIYLPQYSSGNVQGAAYKKGYHLIFNSDGTVTVKRVDAVTRLNTVYPVDGSSSYTSDYTLIGNESLYQTYILPSGCGLIFVEDNTWIEGVIPSKVTVVAAGVDDPSFKPDIVLRNNIIYAATDGTDGLTVISARNILIAPDSPQNMTLNGTFIAQSGAFGRNYYYYPSGGCNGTYEPRGTLTILGTTVSFLRTGTAWVNGCGAGSNAGYQTRIDAFDRQNATNPPPFTPITSTQWKFVDWQQK
ncbi:MAG TPA: hypothetical protein VJI70_00030 [Candidatus Paceibacterota bacterium]